ncbi:MAG: ATP-dependent DNA ligase [Pseudomonadota bacterium]|nr:ATP-dependent DNA ligase [Pseudomonadota bacterium]
MNPATESIAAPEPIEPMLAKAIDAIPAVGDFIFEPKWDGFRALVFRSSASDVAIQSRDLRSLDRYFPELLEALAAALPASCVVDGEIVVATPHGLDFDALQQRLHPAASRVARLARETPASFVAFDLLAVDGRSLIDATQAERRAALEQLLATVQPPLYLTPATRDPALAKQWLQRFEGAGLDGIVAKPLGGGYLPGKRAMLKVKHVRTAECVVAGFRWHKSTQQGGPEAIGSLLLGLYDDAGVLHHVGVTSSFTMAARRELVQMLAPLRKSAAATHPWNPRAEHGAVPKAPSWGSEMGDAEASQRMPGATSRWSAGKDLTWEPLRPERVCEVKYDHLQGDRFRHATTFLRWRTDKPPADCRYDQLEVAVPYELKRVFER